MTIKFATPDTARLRPFGSLNYGRVFKVPGGDDIYYLKTPAFSHCGNAFNCVDLTTGLPGNSLNSSNLVIPVTLEAKEVQP